MLLSSSGARQYLTICILKMERASSSETSVTVANRFGVISKSSPTTPDTLAPTLAKGMYKCARQRPIFARFLPRTFYAPGKEARKYGPKCLYVHGTLLSVIILLQTQKALA
jgi:hypothetical protein